MRDAARILAVNIPAVNIPVGQHITTRIGGITFDADAIWTTVLACLVVLGMGLYLRRSATSGVPGRVQLFWELIVGWVGDQVEQSLGPKYRHVVPLGVTIFMLVLVANWIELLPGLFHNADYLPSPTADVNLTYALAVLVFVLTNAASIRSRGLGGYLRYLGRKPRIMIPLNILEEIAKPLTLALRLFGNMFSGGIMIALLISFPLKFALASLVFTPMWKLFDMFIGVIQAFIFALLTILYYQFAVEEGGH